MNPAALSTWKVVKIIIRSNNNNNNYYYYYSVVTLKLKTAKCFTDSYRDTFQQ